MEDMRSVKLTCELDTENLTSFFGADAPFLPGVKGGVGGLPSVASSLMTAGDEGCVLLVVASAVPVGAERMLEKLIVSRTRLAWRALEASTTVTLDMLRMRCKVQVRKGVMRIEILRESLK
jgi:hypothetical protein